MGWLSPPWVEESFDAPQVVLVKYYSEGGAEDIVGRDRLNFWKNQILQQKVQEEDGKIYNFE